MSARLRLGPAIAFPALALTLASVLACQDQDNQNIPNRVLDRPTDVALICIDRQCSTDPDTNQEVCEAVAVDISSCGATSDISCTAEEPHLVGFVANSERNELAMFTRCDNRLVDMNVDTPGYNFLPSGILPTELTASDDGCRVVSANIGSCDLTVLDGPRLAEFGLQIESSVDQPSSLVSTIVPKRFDPDAEGGGAWVPLGARPGDLIAVPNQLTQAVGLNPGGQLDPNCDPLRPASVYVSFPACNLVAEVDLQTGNVLQSRRFDSDGQGGVSVTDTGISPLCPAECPAQFEGGVPTGLPSTDTEGPFPQALELIEPPPPPPEPTGESGAVYDKQVLADMEVTQTSLLIGGLGSDILFEQRFDDDGVWDSEPLQLELDAANGIRRLRISPPAYFSTNPELNAQYIYAVAGDGSTRVVERPLAGGAPEDIGFECETQLDPNTPGATGEQAGCVALISTPDGDAPAERRGVARGPGIRPSTGGEITDWLFRKTYEGVEDSTGGPFDDPGVVAVGVTSQGQALYMMINQPRASGTTTVGDIPDVLAGTDPLGIMDVRLFPHTQWTGPESFASLPTATDEETSRFIPDGAGPTRSLSPSLRQVDAAYEGESSLDVGANYDRLAGAIPVFLPHPCYDETEDLDEYPAACLERCDNTHCLDVCDPDDPGANTNPDVNCPPKFQEVDNDSFAVYSEDKVPKIVVHDYRSWAPSQWSLEWEGTIVPSSSTGRIDCANPGWEDGTCIPQNPGDAQLIDDSANFCDAGVLPGDKLVLIGCFDDNDCGDGRRCLRETAGGGESSGICISAQAYEDRAAELRQICDNFIRDPCGEAYREYRITAAYQDRLEIQALDPKPISYLTLAEVFNEEAAGTEDETELLLTESEDYFICSDEQPDNGCATDEECSELLGEDQGWLCIEERCRRTCDPGDENDQDCIRRRLPGPACFGEFVRYQVALDNAFRISGPISFLDDVVGVGDDGQCQLELGSQDSRLVSSRLPLPASDAGPEWDAIPECPANLSEVEPGSPNPCKITDPRTEGSLYHTFSYEGVSYVYNEMDQRFEKVAADTQTVSALRFTNPVFTLILDLSSLDSLTAEIPDSEGEAWPAHFARFRRSRIPRGYRETFRIDAGYQPFARTMFLDGWPATFPIHIVGAPQSGYAFVVDGSGSSTSTALRGQVMLLQLDAELNVDGTFDGVR